MKDLWLKPFGLFAAGGFAVALATHLAVLAGIDVASAFPPIWVLHVGIFVAFVPTVFVIKRVGGASGGRAGMQIWRAMLANAPKPVAALVAVLFVYAIANFFFAMSGPDAAGTVAMQGDQFILKVKGRPAEVIDAARYHAHQLAMLRGFSGHWLLFYGLSAVVLLWPPDPASKATAS